MANSRQANDTKRKRRKRRRFLLGGILLILILIVGASLYAAALFNKTEQIMQSSYEPIVRETPKREKKVDPHIDNISVLFVGMDDSEKRKFSGGSRTDALMLATFNDKEKSVKLVSLPRDSYVYIPSKGYKDKINHAYGRGGIVSTIDTVETLLDVPVDYYINLNFNAFVDIVDSLGGIEVEVPYEFREQDSHDKKNAIHLLPGPQVLNGEQALALARTRKKDNDIERGKRQQLILKAIIDKAVSIKSIMKYGEIIDSIGANMKTDLSFGEMTSFIDYLTAGSKLNVETLNLSGKDAYIKGIYYYKLEDSSVESIKTTLQQHLEVSSESETETKSPKGSATT